MSYKPYRDVMEREKMEGKWQPKDDRALLVPLPPLPGTYPGLIWDVLEIGEKALIRLDLGNNILYDVEMWTHDRQGRMSYSFLQFLRAANVKEIQELKGKQFKEVCVDRTGNVQFRR